MEVLNPLSFFLALIAAIVLIKSFLISRCRSSLLEPNAARRMRLWQQPDDQLRQPLGQVLDCSARLIPLLPNSRYGLRPAIVAGPKGMNIEKCAKEIIKYIGRRHGNLGKYRDDFDLLAKHLS